MKLPNFGGEEKSTSISQLLSSRESPRARDPKSQTFRTPCFWNVGQSFFRAPTLGFKALMVSTGMPVMETLADGLQQFFKGGGGIFTAGEDQ